MASTYSSANERRVGSALGAIALALTFASVRGAPARELNPVESRVVIDAIGHNLSAVRTYTAAVRQRNIRSGFLTRDGHVETERWGDFDADLPKRAATYSTTRSVDYPGRAAPVLSLDTHRWIFDGSAHMRVFTYIREGTTFPPQLWLYPADMRQGVGEFYFSMDPMTYMDLGRCLVQSSWPELLADGDITVHSDTYVGRGVYRVAGTLSSGADHERSTFSAIIDPTRSYMPVHVSIQTEPSSGLDTIKVSVEHERYGELIHVPVRAVFTLAAASPDDPTKAVTVFERIVEFSDYAINVDIPPMAFVAPDVPEELRATRVIDLR